MSKTVPYPLPITGVDSLSNETALPKGAVRSAVNVDIGRAGRFSRRVGQKRLVDGNNFHSIWASGQRGTMLVAQGSKLMRFTNDNQTVPFADLNSGDMVSYTEYNGNLYWSNKTTFGWLPSNSGVPRTVGVPTPATNPSLAPAAGGLLPGKYGVAVSLVDERGEEGGTSDVQFIDLPSGGGFQLSNLQTIPGWRWFVYLTDANGEKLRLGAQFPAVFPQYTVTEVAKGGDCDTQHLKPMPHGSFVTWLAGRLYIANGSTLYFSNALRPHLYNPAHNLIPFSGNISFVEAVTDGMYVGDERGVWFLDGTDPTQFKMRLVSTCRAVRGSSIKIPPEHLPEKKVPATNPVALWLSTSGYTVGMDGGATVELQPERIKVPAGLTGRTVYLFRKGMKQVVTPVNSTSTVAFGTAVDSVIT